MKFVIYESSPGKWYWRLVAKNGKTIADGSESYASNGNCRKAVLRVMLALQGVVDVEVRIPKK